MFASTESSRGAGPYLALNLLRALTRVDPRWSLPTHVDALTLHKSALGAPSLHLCGKQGPSLSFSHGERRLWAAMSATRSVGIDVAYPKEFAGDYPFHRAFRPQELDWARHLCSNVTAPAAALIWSLKEASVKATGEGFHLIDPLDVRVGTPSFRRGQGIVFEVLAHRPVSAWASEESGGWLSVALA
ncbi:MAG: 4'-phosphopantetheinyl transferase superfamily protein [Deltaproteobacteria bacterium]|nr:4'-phosphopantetheinyl transferase superfamily protein [Deltaproteobacteria bacterium]